jgi:hypothetical protein
MVASGLLSAPLLLIAGMGGKSQSGGLGESCHHWGSQCEPNWRGCPMFMNQWGSLYVSCRWWNESRFKKIFFLKKKIFRENFFKEKILFFCIRKGQCMFEKAYPVVEMASFYLTFFNMFISSSIVVEPKFITGQMTAQNTSNPSRLPCS